MSVMEFSRFEHLADTQGGDLNRWPERERAAAHRLLEADPRAGRLLADARLLDAVLAEWRVEPASAALRERVLAGAEVRRAGRTIIHGVRLWFAGAGLAAAAAGVFCGVSLASVAVREAQDEAAFVAAYRDPVLATSSLSEPVRAL